MAKVVSFINYKGGVGKTTLAVEIAASLSHRYEFRVLLADLDPQTNATFYLMREEAWEEWTETHGSLKGIFNPGVEPPDVRSVIVTDMEVTAANQRLHLLPSHLDLMNLDLQLASQWGPAGIQGKLILTKALRVIQDDYDFIICDCPPNLNLVTQNAIAASHSIIIVTMPDYLAVRGIDLIGTAVEHLGEEIQEFLALYGGSYSSPTIDGIVFNKVRYRTGGTITEETIMDTVRRRTRYQDQVFTSYLSLSQRIADRPLSKIPRGIIKRCGNN